MKFYGKILSRFNAGPGTPTQTDILYQGETDADTIEKARNNIWFQAAVNRHPSSRRIYQALQNAKTEKQSHKLRIELSHAIGKFRQYYETDFKYKCEVTEYDGGLPFESRLKNALYGSY